MIPRLPGAMRRLAGLLALSTVAGCGVKRPPRPAPEAPPEARPAAEAPPGDAGDHEKDRESAGPAAEEAGRGAARPDAASERGTP